MTCLNERSADPDCRFLRADDQLWMPLNADQKGVAVTLHRLNRSTRGTVYDLEWRGYCTDGLMTGLLLDVDERGVYPGAVGCRIYVPAAGQQDPSRKVVKASKRRPGQFQWDQKRHPTGLHNGPCV